MLYVSRSCTLYLYNRRPFSLIKVMELDCPTSTPLNPANSRSGFNRDGSLPQIGVVARDNDRNLKSGWSIARWTEYDGKGELCCETLSRFPRPPRGPWEQEGTNQASSLTNTRPSCHVGTAEYQYAKIRSSRVYPKPPKPCNIRTTLSVDQIDIVINITISLDLRLSRGTIRFPEISKLCMLPAPVLITRAAVAAKPRATL